MTVQLWVGIPASLLLSVVVAELGARWWLRHRRHYYVFPPSQRLLLRVDRDVFPQMEPLVRFDVNREGERGGEVPRSSDGLYRVLVAGGSQPEGYLLDQGSCWPGVLQRLLQSADHLDKLGASKVHVGNIGRSGVGSEGLDLVLERVLPRYPRLQAIVILVGVSDVSRWVELGAPPAPPPAVRTSDVFKCHPEGPFGWKPKELAMFELIQRLRRRWFRPVQVHERAGQWVGHARAMRARANVIRTTVPDPAPMLDHFDTHIRRVLRRAATHADRVLLVRQPWFEKDYSPEEAAHMWHGGVGQAWREPIDVYYSFEVFFRLMALLDARAAAAATDLGVEQLDAMPILERSLNTYYDCFHLTPAGAQTLAAAVADVLVRQPRSATGDRDLRSAGRADGFASKSSGNRPAVGHWAALRVPGVQEG